MFLADNRRLHTAMGGALLGNLFAFKDSIQRGQLDGQQNHHYRSVAIEES